MQNKYKAKRERAIVYVVHPLGLEMGDADFSFIDNVLSGKGIDDFTIVSDMDQISEPDYNKQIFIFSMENGDKILDEYRF